MKFFKASLRLWITMTSLTGFVGGWILLAHSPKPQPPQQARQVELTALPTLPPIASFDANGNFQPAQSFVPSSSFLPRFRTGGS
jgi:hypothetical protein